MVMVFLQKDWFPKGQYDKLKMNKFGPSKIQKKLGTNVYPLDLPKELDMSSIFNIVHLYDYNQDKNVNRTDNILTH